MNVRRTMALALVIGLNSALAGAPARSAAEIGGRFALTGTDGKIVTDETFRGKWLVLYFGYTACPDVCPTVLTELGAALGALGPLAAKVQVVFVTLDPARDTASALRDYLGSFDARIVGLRGSGDEIENVAKEYHVYYRAHSLGNGEYAVDHSSFLYVIRPDGRFDSLLAGDLPGHRLADELRRRVR